MKKADNPGHSGKQASWGGRFAEPTSPLMSAYTDSQHYDRALYAEDIRASKAHAHMLGKQGILTTEEAAIIISGLDIVLNEIKSGKFVWKESLEDVHMNVEARLIELVGEAGKKLHTGRSRNDQVSLDFRLYVSGCCNIWQQLCVEFIKLLCILADNHRQTLLPGFTHMQPAQPVLLAQHLLAYANMFKRDVSRLADLGKRLRISPLGAAALAGTTYPLDPQSVASEVGFPTIFDNSMDAVSDRDFVLEALFAASMIMMHLSRLCEEIILWANPFFGYVTLPDAFSTGSSIMPQKRNPDAAELARGKTGRVYGHLMALLTTMKALPLAYNRDMQEDKEGFFDTDATVKSSLEIIMAMLKNMTFNTSTMANACKTGFMNATELADYLVAKGIGFRSAHHLAGEAVGLAEELGVALEDLPLEKLRGISSLIDADVFQSLDYTTSVRRRETPGGTGPNSINRQLENFKNWLANFDEHNDQSY